MLELAFKTLLSLNILNLFTFFCFKFHTLRRALDAEMNLSNLEGVANKSKKAERDGITGVQGSPHTNVAQVRFLDSASYVG